MKKIIVTGGAGFIGTHLCERLLTEGNEVICVDNLYTGSKDNLKRLSENKNFSFIEHDIINPIKIKCDEIYNFACPASPVHYQADYINTLKTNVFGAYNMLELAKENGAKILQASTSEVYGNPLVHPQVESYVGNVNPIGIRSCYDEGKRAAETLMMDFHRQCKVDSKLVRIFNTYGPYMNEHDGRVVSNFVVQALRGDDITIYGDGSQTRSFCYVSDLVDGIIRMMKKENFTGPVNLGNPMEYPIIKFAEIVLEITKSKSKIVYKELPSDDPLQRKPDISLAWQELGWKPFVTLYDGINKTVDYFAKII